ncbi:MAG: efflux RND transporter permease subunit, partial [Balneolaceae bacterium]
MNEENLNKKNNRPGADISKRKEFALTSFSINNRISVLVLLVLITILGVRSYLTIPKESAPDITIPNIIVITTYPGVSPEDVENLVTRKLEDELSNISDYKKMTSTTTEGYSSINMEFNTDVNIDEALQKVREKVDLAKPELPSDVDDPVIMEINISEFPIMQVNISGDYGLDQLKTVAEELQEAIETIPQVLEVDLAGGIEKEVKVDIDLPRLKYYGIAFKDVIEAIQNENVTIPGGTVDVGTKKFLMRVPGEYDTPQPIEDIVIDAQNDKPVYIRDIARVSFAEKDRESFAFLDRSPVITLSVKKRTGQNIIETSEAVRAIIDRELPAMPPTTVVQVTSDQSEDIRMMVSSLENNIISGLFLVIGVLLFFLGVRNSSFVGISIPVSMFMSFVILQALGITMNMIVLFSLILALGMLVDNAIVVVENIYRYLEEGFNNLEAAKKGTGEVAMPIISGTTTTLAAFLPMIFWPGMVGDFMSFLPKTLIITLGSSLFVGLVINPVLCAVFMKLEQDDSGEKKATLSVNGKIFLSALGGLMLTFAIYSNWISTTMLLVIGLLLVISHEFFMKPVGDRWQKKGLQVVLDKYESTLRWALNFRFVVVGIAVLVLCSSFLIFWVFNYGVVFFPEDIPPKRIYAQIETPAGTNVNFTRTFIEEMERRVDTLPNREDVETVVSTAGAVISSGMEPAGGSMENRGTVVLNFLEYQQRSGNTLESLESMRETFPRNIAGAKITIEKQQEGPPTGKPINLEISGRDMDVLTRLSGEALRILENDPVYGKLDGLETDLPEPRPEMRILVDREKAAIFGLNTSDVGNTVRQAINGVEASKFRDGNDEYDITVRLAEEFRQDLSTLADLNIITEEGRQIPLSEIAV